MTHQNNLSPAAEQSESVALSLVWPGIDKRPKNRGGEAGSETCRRESFTITQNTPGLGSNGEVPSERKGYLYRGIAASSPKPPFSGRALRTNALSVKTRYEPMVDSRQVPSPTRF